MSKWKPPAVKPAPKPVVVEEPTPIEETQAAEAPTVEQVEAPAIEVEAEEPTNVVTFTAEEVKAPDEMPEPTKPIFGLIHEKKLLASSPDGDSLKAQADALGLESTTVVELPKKAPTYRHVDGDRNVQTLSREAAIKLLADRLKIRGEVAEALLPTGSDRVMTPSAMAGSRTGTLELS